MLRFDLDKKFKDTDYMDASERMYFKGLRERNVVSIFNVAICKKEDCREETPTTKNFCSLECKTVSEGGEKEDGDVEEKW